MNPFLSNINIFFSHYLFADNEKNKNADVTFMKQEARTPNVKLDSSAFNILRLVNYVFFHLCETTPTLQYVSI